MDEPVAFDVFLISELNWLLSQTQWWEEFGVQVAVEITKNTRAAS